MSGNRLRLVYVAGIAFNVIALVTAVRAGQTLFAATFALIMVYLGIRYWMVAAG